MNADSDHDALMNAGRRWRRALALGLLLAFGIEAHAVNKCLIDGKITYQDAPCAEARETVGQALEKKERNELLHRKLDRLAAQGHGLVQRAPPTPPPQRAQTEEGEMFVPRPRSRAAENARQARVSADLQEQTERKNAQSAASLTRLLDDAKQACGGKLPDYPSVGMSDENFRNCTLHARFGGATQVVVSEDGSVPLRLYLFPGARASRVYSIGGVVTAISP